MLFVSSLTEAQDTQFLQVVPQKKPLPLGRLQCPVTRGCKCLLTPLTISYKLRSQMAVTLQKYQNLVIYSLTLFPDN